MNHAHASCLALSALVALSSFAHLPAHAQDAKPAPKKERKKDEPWPTPKKPEKLKAVDARDVESAIRRGVALLVDRQETLEKDADAAKSEWPYEGVYRVDGQIPVGYRIGGTAIVAMALLEASGDKLSDATRAAVLRALDFVQSKLDDPRMTPDWNKGYDVRGWGHAYGLAFLLDLRKRGLVPAEKKAAVDARVVELVKVLQDTEIRSNGGWNYSRSSGDDSSASPFMTAPTLQILFEAAAQGLPVDAAVVERGLKTLEDARLDTGAFQYATNPKRKSGKGIEEVPGSTGRSPIAEVTLFLAGRSSVERIESAVQQFFEHWEWLEQRRKQSGTHIGPYAIAPYFFYYAHRYCAQAIEFLPEKPRAEYRQKLYQLLWHVREEDGGWNDRVFPRSEGFGTAMTLFALEEPTHARPAGWSKPKTEAPK